jgi:hypothetical protein
MRRDQLAHVLRAAATIVHDGDILVIGSQAILASFDEDQLPERATASIEVDVAFFDDVDASKADEVDGAIGELSPFHQSFGIYGQGVEVKTAVLPAGWRDRLVEFAPAESQPSHARCLDPHDLVISKLVARREKDIEFASALIGAGLISCEVLKERARMTEPAGGSARLIAQIQGLEALAPGHEPGSGIEF